MVQGKILCFQPITSTTKTASSRSVKHLLGSPVLTLLCGIHSRSALGITSSSGWNSSQNPTTSPTLLPPDLVGNAVHAVESVNDRPLRRE
uniref:Uncharacterized protein n=1 Tax=Aegilops tauschii subsp. strangulata TaxID=200361 RepID=A0A453LYZ2_AEGTS